MSQGGGREVLTKVRKQIDGPDASETQTGTGGSTKWRNST